MDIQQGLKPGSTLRNGTYRIERVLGQGGFGITYLATDLTLDRKVAVKEFFPKDYCDRNSDTSHVTLGTSSTEAFVRKLKAKFLKEARNIAKFDNPGIIRIFAAFEENNTAYYIMEYIEGLTFSEMVKGYGAMSPERALSYIGKVGEALDFVHSHRMNHLDVKPANIIVRGSDDMPVLIDFGLSKQYNSDGQQTSTTPTGMSPGYAPIEQYNYGGVGEFSPQTDLYSLAATLYYLLTATVPPQAINLVDEPLTFPDTVPDKLTAPMRKAMSSSRKNRHESVREFLNEILPENRNAAPAPPRQVVSNLANNQKYEVEVEDDYPNRSKKVMGWVISIAAVVLIAGGLLWWTFTDKGGEPVVVAEEPQAEMVKNMYWESPLGTTAYTGEVIEDEDGNKIPHGKGFARVTSGKFEGNIYDGEFVEGRMEGTTKYTMKNGDTFVGTFENNQYKEGKYTIKKTSEYFEGTFTDGNPDKGHWYNWKGRKID